MQDVISTLAGTGAAGTSGDGGDPLDAQFNKPNGIAIGSDGSIFISEEDGNVVRVIRPDGNIYRFAGEGGEGDYDGDGDDALDARFHKPHDIDIASNGNVYVVDKNNNVIRLISASSGNIFTVAGSGSKGYGGDLEYATDADMNRPTGIALDSLGGYYIADKDNNRVRRVGAGNWMWLACGDGSASSTGDGDDCTDATLDKPFDVMEAQDGTVYMTESDGERVRRYFPFDSIETVAGGGELSAATGWIDPLDLNFGTPRGMAQDKWGRIYIADEGRDSIYQIREDGLVRRVVGTGEGTYGGDGGFSGAAKIKDPRFLGVLEDGSLVIADKSNHRVRIVHW